MDQAYVRSSCPEGPEYVYLYQKKVLLYSPVIHNKCRLTTKFY
jgi:hypothetical protein